MRLIGLLAALCLVVSSQPGFSSELPTSAPVAAAAPVDAGVSSAVPAARKASNLAVITIEGEINAVTARSVKRRLDQAIAGGADGIVFDIDSPGGEIGAVLEICTAIKQSTVPNTIGWVNPNAYSGGAIIALACREIIVSPHATMGDAAPVAFSPVQGIVPLPQTERAKLLAPLLAEVVDSARLNGYDEKLVQGLVALGVELWLIEDSVTGQRHCVDEAEYRTIFGRPPARGTPLIASGTAGSLAQGVAPPIEADAPVAEQAPAEALPEPAQRGRAGEAEILGRESAGSAAGREAAAEAGAEGGGGGGAGFIAASPEIDAQTQKSVSDTLASPSKRPVFSGADRARYRSLGYITDGQSLLTMKEGELKYLGFARTTIKDDQELKDYVGAVNLRRLDQNWSEHLVEFMTQGQSGFLMRILLIIVFLLAMFIEMSVPGVGIAGVVAALAFFGLVVPPMLIGAANWWAGAAIIAGVGLVLLEILVLPGLGFAGITGVLMLMLGLVGIFSEAGALFPGQKSGNSGDLAWAGSVVLLSVFVSGLGMFLFSKYTHRFPLAGRLVLTNRPSSDDSSDGMLAAMAAVSEGAPVPLGAVGKVVTPLRPAGSAEFDDRLVDVVAEFGFIDAGESVRVVSATPYRVGVERVNQAGAAKPPREQA